MNLNDYIASLRNNIRQGHGFEDMTFRQTDLEGNQTSEEFTGTELEARLNAVKQSNGSAVFQLKCPKLSREADPENRCSMDWHPFSVTINGGEYIDTYMVYKMNLVGSVWLDANDLSGTINQGGSGDAPSEGSASVDGDPVLSENINDQ